MTEQSKSLQTNHRQTQIRPVIYVVCILGALGSLPTLLLWTTELAYMVGQWYLNFILFATLLTWVGLVGIWKLKKWGTIVYTLTAIVTQIIFFKHNVMWSYTSLIIPFIVTLTSWFYFKIFK
jgi:hypothetical protein